MKKTRFGLLVLSLSLLAGANARTLTPAEALQRSGGDVRLRGVVSGLKQSHLVYTEITETGSPAVYVFDKSGGNGCVFLSADDIAYPVLGYTDGSFNPQDMSPALKWWLGEYARQIQYAQDNGIKSDVKSAIYDSWAPITPMIKSKWGQDAPYNNDCPSVNNRKCPTGCVATAMAQVMNYFKYPEVGTGRLSVMTNGVTSSMTLDNYPFDWDNMLDTYLSGQYNDVQAQAVATLMKACGYSVQMNYSVGGSGTQSAYISEALRKNFNYDAGVSYECRISYSASEWESKVYESLKSGSPVIYNGQDPNQGGHSFVCDGYDKDGYFHINWGWGGTSDGYYSLNALNPEALGTGGGSGGGFNFTQDAIFNIKKPEGGVSPETGTPLLTVAGALTVDQVNGSTIMIGLADYYNLAWRNDTSSRLNLSLGGVFTREGSDEIVASATAKLNNGNTVTLQAGTYYPYYYNGRYSRVSVTVPSSLPNGRYKMTLCGKDANHPNDPWETLIHPYGYPDYIYVTKNGSTITAEAITAPAAQLSSASLEGTLYYNRNVTLKATLHNPTQYELTPAPMLVLSNAAGTRQFVSGSILVPLQPGETKEIEWTISLYAVNGAKGVTTPTDFNMSIVNEYTDQTMGEFGTVTMNPNPGNPTIKINSIGIPGYETEQVKIGNSNYTIYKVDEGEPFTLDLDFTITKGYFDSKVKVGILRVLDGATTATQTISVVDEIFAEKYTLAEGESVNISVPVNFPEAQKGVYYVLDPRYTLNNSSRSIGQVRFWIGPDSAVSEIEAEDGEGIKEYYSIDGLKIDNPQPGTPVIVKSGSKVSKQIMK